ncbi:MAG: ABC transporter substrate-binding protein [Deltaproteobacteria bacterium]|nr:ABC transporter substrate-binding protein [Deltaproteobacteria bacterium]
MRFVKIAASILVVIAAASITYAQNPLARTNELVALFKQVKKAEKGKSLSSAEQKANDAIYKQLDDFYDFDTIASEPLKPHKNKLTPAQQAKILPNFKELIRLVAYPQSGGFLQGANYKIKAGPTANETQMDANAPEKDFETTVIFRWQKQKNTWRIIDVSFDGASLIQDYKNQFGRIIKKEGGEGLIKKLEKRLDKERKKQGK